jgi:hypothetical protein
VHIEIYFEHNVKDRKFFEAWFDYPSNQIALNMVSRFV